MTLYVECRAVEVGSVKIELHNSDRNAVTVLIKHLQYRPGSEGIKFICPCDDDDYLVLDEEKHKNLINHLRSRRVPVLNVKEHRKKFAIEHNHLLSRYMRALDIAADNLRCSLRAIDKNDQMEEMNKKKEYYQEYNAVMVKIYARLNKENERLATVCNYPKENLKVFIARPIAF